MRGDTRVRLTPRGRALAIGGGVVALLGFAIGLPDLVVVGLAPALAVAVTGVLTAAHRPERRRGALATVRRIAPNPVSSGQLTEVQLSVTSARADRGAAGLLARTRISENIAAELAGRAPRGRQDAAPGEIRVTYSLRPGLRGRWALGPATASVDDAFGLVTVSRPFGSTATVTVWPAVVPLAAHAASSLLVSSDVAAGSRRASPDDAVLREYVVGDDLRRVHWPSAARRGRLMVRSDEGAGTPPATVLVDRGLLPSPSNRAAVTRREGEWTVTCAASVAVALVEAGHGTRIVGTSADGDALGVPHAHGGRGDGRAAVLDQAVDLAAFDDPTVATRALVATARALQARGQSDEIVVALVGPQPDEVTESLAGIAGDGFHGAVVVVPRSATSAMDALAERTASTLRASGWHAVAVVDGLPVERVWASLAEDGAR